MKRLLTTVFAVFLLTFVVSSAFANDAVNNGNANNNTVVSQLNTSNLDQKVSGGLAEAKQFATTLSPPETDYSVAYLGQIFGTVGNVLQSTSGQVLGKLFDIFNKGVLVVAAFYLAMTVVQLAMRAAGEGSFMGQNRNVYFTLLRIALGFALILPSSTTGYSALQDIFMRIVVAGVGLADQTWDTALQFLRYGGELYIPPANLTTDTNIISSATGSQSAPGPVTQILQDEVCMISSANWEKSSWKQNHPGQTAPYFSSYKPVYTDAATGIIYFPGMGNSASAGADAYSIGGTSTSASPAFSACGYTTSYLYVAPGQTSTITANMTPNQIAAGQAYAYTALKQLTMSLMPASKELADHPNAASDATQLAGQNNIKTVFSAILAYANLITPLQHMLDQQSSLAGKVGSVAASSAGASTSTTLGLTPTEVALGLSNGNPRGYIPAAEAQGWIMAGAFYWNLEQANKASASISLGNLMPAAPALHTLPLSIYNTSSSLTRGPLFGVVIAMVFDYQAPMDAPTQGLNILWSQYVGAQQNTVTGSATTNTSGDNSGLAGSLESSMLGKITSTVYSLNDSGAYNPIVTLMNLGNKLLEACVGIWIAAVAISLTAAAIGGICDSTQPGGVIVQAVLTWLKSIVMLVTTLLIVPGAILAYYVPMYPFAVFTFAAVGWFLIVIEGMAAAPLVCLGVTHPEGHDFLGKAEQALMLFLSIFLRPALMVIGLVAAMVVSFVAFHMLISGFGTVMSALSNSSSGALSNGLLIGISIVMVLVIFGMITMELIEQCYKLIFQLPQYILRWIGGPSDVGGEYGQMAGALKGGISTGASNVGQGVVDPLKSAGATADKLGKKNADNDSKGTQSSTTPK